MDKTDRGLNMESSTYKKTQQEKKTSKKKYLLIGGIFVLCALVLKRDAH